MHGVKSERQNPAKGKTVKKQSRKQLMAETEAIKKAIAQAVVKAGKATVLAINREGRRQNFHPEEAGASDSIRHRMGPFLRQPRFNYTAKDK